MNITVIIVKWFGLELIDCSQGRIHTKHTQVSSDLDTKRKQLKRLQQNAWFHLSSALPLQWHSYRYARKSPATLKVWNVRGYFEDNSISYKPSSDVYVSGWKCDLLVRKHLPPPAGAITGSSHGSGQRSDGTCNFLSGSGHGSGQRSDGTCNVTAMARCMVFKWDKHFPPPDGAVTGSGHGHGWEIRRVYADSAKDHIGQSHSSQKESFSAKQKVHIGQTESSYRPNRKSIIGQND